MSDLHRHAVQRDDLMVPVELVGLARREGQRHECAPRRTRMRFAPAPRISPDGVASASVAERPQLLENPDHRHPLARRRFSVRRQQPIDVSRPSTQLRPGLDLSPIGKRHLGRSQDLAHRVTRQLQLARDLPDRLALNEMLASNPTDRPHNQLPPPPLRAKAGRRATANQGSILDTDLRLRGSLFHAETQDDARYSRAERPPRPWLQYICVERSLKMRRAQRTAPQRKRRARRTRQILRRNWQTARRREYRLVDSPRNRSARRAQACHHNGTHGVTVPSKSLTAVIRNKPARDQHQFANSLHGIDSFVKPTPVGGATCHYSMESSQLQELNDLVGQPGLGTSASTPQGAIVSSPGRNSRRAATSVPAR